MLAGKTDSEMRATAAQNADKEEGFVIHKKQVVSDDDVFIFVSMIGNDQVEKVEVKRIENEWKVDGPKQ